MRLVTLATFSVFYLSVAFGNPRFQIAANAFAEEAPFHLNYTKTDFNYGKDIDLIFTELSKNDLKKKSVDALARYQQKANSFSIFNSTYERLKKILIIHDQDSFYKNCSIISKGLNTPTGSIVDRINISIDQYCRDLFLKRLSLLSSNINFSSRDITYFKEASPFFSSGENRPDLVAFLRHFKTNAIEHEKISNILIEKYIELKIRPPTNVLTNLKVSSMFNKFLQNNLNLDDTSNSYFNEEFLRLSRSAQEAAENGDYQLSKSSIISAVSFYNKNKNFISNKKAWNGVILTGKALFYKGRDTDAIEIFNLAKSIASKDDYAESIFYLVWPHIINRNYNAIKTIIEKNNLEASFDKFDSKLQYWIAYSLLKIGDVKKGSAYFNKIISNSPYSFYSIISLKELALLAKGTVSETEILSKLISKNEPLDYSLDKTTDELQDSLKRLAIWNKLGNERFATLELRFIESLNKEETFKDPAFAKTLGPQAHKEFLITNLIRLLNSQKRYVASFKVFQESLDQNSLSLNYKLMKYIFPLNYIDIIKKNCVNLDPLIVISLIRQESAFNPEARSGVGAKGLMQLMPATAKRFNRKIRIKHLGNPEINVAIGTKYLRQLINRFDGNLIYALASYNAGENRIDRWRKEIFRSDDPLSTIESIPFEETRNYVKLIYRNNFFYSLLSNKPTLMIPLEETFKVSLNGKKY